MTPAEIEAHALRAARFALTEGVALWDAVLATSHAGVTLAEEGGAYYHATDRLRVVPDDHDRKVRSEALRDAAEDLIHTVDDLSYTGTDLSYRKCTSMDVEFLQVRADRIENGDRP